MLIKYYLPLATRTASQKSTPLLILLCQKVYGGKPYIGTGQSGGVGLPIPVSLNPWYLSEMKPLSLLIDCRWGYNSMYVSCMLRRSLPMTWASCCSVRGWPRRCEPAYAHAAALLGCEESRSESKSREILPINLESIHTERLRSTWKKILSILSDTSCQDSRSWRIASAKVSFRFTVTPCPV